MDNTVCKSKVRQKCDANHLPLQISLLGQYQRQKAIEKIYCVYLDSACTLLAREAEGDGDKKFHKLEKEISISMYKR